MGAELSYHDAFVDEAPELGLSSVSLQTVLEDAEAVVIVTAHPGIDDQDVAARVPLVVDFRGVTRQSAATHVHQL